MESEAQHPSAERLEGYGHRTLAAEEMLTVGDHVAACAECRERILGSAWGGERLKSALAALRVEIGGATAPVSEHLTDEQAAAYVDDDMDEFEREVVEGHLEGCARCSEEVRELRGFRVQMTTYASRDHVPSPRHSVWLRVRRSISRPYVWIPAQAVAIGAAAAWFVLVTGVRPLERQMSRQVDVVRGLRGENDSLRVTTSSLENRLAVVPQLHSQIEARELEMERLRRTGSRLRNQISRLRESAGDGPGRSRRPAGLLVFNDRAGWVDREGNLLRKEPLPAAVHKALDEGRLQPPRVLASLRSRARMARGPRDPGIPFALVRPMTTAVESDRPTFSWRAVKGATRYLVTVYDQSAGGVVASGSVSDTRWTPGDALRRDRVYWWEVEALTNGRAIGKAPQPPAPPARFKVLGAEHAATLQVDRERYSGSHLALGVLYAEAGVLDAAEHEFRQFREANPHSRIARQLLESLRAIRRLAALGDARRR